MKRSDADVADDPVVVPIPGDDGTSMEGWLASLRHDGPPTDLGMSAAELVAEARRDYE